MEDPTKVFNDCGVFEVGQELEELVDAVNNLEESLIRQYESDGENDSNNDDDDDDSLNEKKKYLSKLSSNSMMDFDNIVATAKIIRSKLNEEEEYFENAEDENEDEYEDNINDLSNDSMPFSPKRTIDLLLYLHQRSINHHATHASTESVSQSHDEEDEGRSEGGDEEWVNDDDNGYVVVTVSEQEFIEYDQVCRQIARDEAELSGMSSSSSNRERHGHSHSRDRRLSREDEEDGAELLDSNSYASQGDDDDEDVDGDGDGDSYNSQGLDEAEELSSKEGDDSGDEDDDDDNDDEMERDLAAVNAALDGEGEQGELCVDLEKSVFLTSELETATEGAEDVVDAPDSASNPVDVDCESEQQQTLPPPLPPHMTPSLPPSAKNIKPQAAAANLSGVSEKAEGDIINVNSVPSSVEKLGQGQFGVPSLRQKTGRRSEAWSVTGGPGDNVGYSTEDGTEDQDGSEGAFGAVNGEVRNQRGGMQNRRQSLQEQRRAEITGQHSFVGVDGKKSCFFNLKVIFDPYRTGFEENKDFQYSKGSVIAGRYQVSEVLGTAAFSTALQCVDLIAEEGENQWVCLKVIKNNKDFFDQSMDEIKLLQFINSRGDPDVKNVLRLYDYFYYKEHLFIVSELLKENLYEFGKFIRDHDHEPFYTLPRLKRMMKQILVALKFIHSLNLIHCDIKPENIVIKSFSRCEVKLIDFGSSCYTTDHLTTYIQSRSYRAPEVILGMPYDARIDIWSLGAVLAELYTGYVLFQNDSVPTMLARITGILGPFEDHVLARGKEVPKYFTRNRVVYERDEDGAYQMIFPKRTSLQNRLHLVPSVPVRPHSSRRPDSTSVTDSPVPLSPSVRGEEEVELELSYSDALFLDFTAQLLHLDPLKRLTASQALCHPWLADADTIQFPEYIIGQPASHPATSGTPSREGSGVFGAHVSTSGHKGSRHSHSTSGGGDYGDSFGPPPLPDSELDDDEEDDECEEALDANELSFEEMEDFVAESMTAGPGTTVRHSVESSSVHIVNNDGTIDDIQTVTETTTSTSCTQNECIVTMTAESVTSFHHNKQISDYDDDEGEVEDEEEGDRLTLEAGDETPPSSTATTAGSPTVVDIVPRSSEDTAGDTVVYQAALSPEGSSPVADSVDIAAVVATTGDIAETAAVSSEVVPSETVASTPQPGDDIVYVPPVATATPPPVEVESVMEIEGTVGAAAQDA